MMGTCEACGHQLSAATKFCPECGHSTSVPMIELVTEPGTPSNSGSRRRANGGMVGDAAPGKRPKMPVGLLAMAVFVAVAALVLPGVFNGSTDAAGEAPAVPLATATPPPSPPTPEVEADAIEDPTSDSPAQSVVAASLTADTLLAAELPSEILVVVTPTDLITLLDLATGERWTWDPPEPLIDENPAVVGGSVVVVGESRAWARSLVIDPTGADPNWAPLGLADRVRFSTKTDRVWLRRTNPKERPSDADFLWNEVDLAGEVQRTMFRDREIYFPTPELVSGIGGDLFRLTDASINAWRVFSPYGVLIATGPNDLIVKECNSDRTCDRVWYDTANGQRRRSVYSDLADGIQASYGALLSLDGRFVYSRDGDDGVYIRSVATGESVPNNCRWSAPLVWTAGSEVFARVSDRAVELYDTSAGVPLGVVDLGSRAATDDAAGAAVHRFVFVPTGS